MYKTKEINKDSVFSSEIERLVKSNPNDMALGNKIRKLVNSRLEKKNILKEQS